jgi:hypothetical protein
LHTQVGEVVEQHVRESGTVEIVLLRDCTEDLGAGAIEMPLRELEQQVFYVAGHVWTNIHGSRRAPINPRREPGA